MTLAWFYKDTQETCFEIFLILILEFFDLFTFKSYGFSFIFIELTFSCTIF